MRKKILLFSKVFLIVGLFIINAVLASTSLAANSASATISPTTASTEQNQTYTYTVTNGATSTATIRSIEIQLPTGFGTPSINIASASSGKIWVLSSSNGYVNGFNSSAGKIGVNANDVANRLEENESVEIQVTVLAPIIANSYEWTASVWGNLDFSGTLFELTSPQPTVNVTVPATETFIIRNGDTVLYNGSVPLPASGTVSINDANGIGHTVNTRSVLAILKSIDDGSDAFSISNLQYFDSFGAFYIKCILPNGGTEMCDNWQYAVGDFTPFSSVDQTILSGGETVGIYFGNSHQLVLSTNSIRAGESLNATAQKYDYENNIWNPLTGVSVGVTLPNPAELWNPTVISTSPVDALGNATITIASPNTYTLGIVEDFYFPSYIVTVSAIPSSGGGGGFIPPTFNVPSALSYLKSVQSPDGSFGGVDLYTDWVAIAFGALNVTDDSRDKLLAYLNSNNQISSIVTDNERRAMALMALGQNPYSFNGVNYIGAITESFDGTQFGDADLVNDDIFALIPLGNAGFVASDNVIAKALAFIISKQKTNGSWEESVDITSAAIQALKLFESVSGVSDALLKATSYLTSEQKSNGGFGSVYSTSWAMQAMSALSASWNKDGYTPNGYLTLQQASDGAVLSPADTIQNRIWATSYAIPAISGKPWSAIMQSFPKSVTQNVSSSAVVLQDTSNTAPVVVSNTIPPSNETNLVATSAPTLDKKVVNPEPEKSKITVLQDLPTNTQEILPNAQTATALNALPENIISSNSTSIVLGVLSGIVLIFFFAKFFIL